MRTLLKITGYIIFIASGLFMWWAYMLFWENWLGIFGILIAIFSAPGVILFPAIVWIKTGVFPLGYIILWAIGIFGGGFFYWLGSLGEDR